MNAQSINKMIASLEAEIRTTQKGHELDLSLERLQEISKSYHGEDMLVSFDEIAKRIKNEGDEEKIMTGWKGLDELLKGFRLQQLVVVSALTKSGKTTFLMDLTTRLKDYNPLWLPFEESAEELIRKFLERGEQPPHGFTPSQMKGGELLWIEQKIVEAKAKFGTKIVFIDQLDFIVPPGVDNHALRVGEAMRSLKGIAKKWEVVIVLICHLVKTKMDTQPTMEDLKGSSSIGQEADTVILLWREMKRERGQVVITNNTNVSVQANRRCGKTGNVKMVFDNGHFLEGEWQSVLESSAQADEDFDNF